MSFYRLCEVIDQQQFYIRWGNIPEGGRSRNWKINYKKPRFHKGLSVYRVTWDEQRKQWILDDQYIPFLGRETIYSLRHGTRPIYLLQGKQVDIGPDNEPLIKDAVIIKPLKPQDIFIPHIDDPVKAKAHQDRLQDWQKRSWL